MDKIRINSKQVKDVRQEGIVYIDHEGNEQFIDFEWCYQNYLHPRLTLEAFQRIQELNPGMPEDFEAYSTRIKRWKQIALRNMIGLDFVDGEAQYGLPYFELHTKPRVRIEFENEDAFHEMHHKIEREYRWHTFDMT